MYEMNTLRQKILFITLVPGGLLLGLLGSYLLLSRFNDMEQQFYLRGKAIAEQLAAASVGNIMAHNHDALQIMGKDAMRLNPRLQGIQIVDQYGLNLLQWGSTENSPEFIPFSAAITTSSDLHDIYQYALTQPIAIGDDNKVDLGTLTVWLDNNSLQQKKQEILWATAAVSATGLAIIVLLSLFLSRRISRPIERLTEATRQMAAGQLHTRVKLESSGEIAELESAFNRMAEEIQQASKKLQAKVEQATLELQQSMEVLEIKNVELDLARQKALQAMRVKSEFVANMSHEIRTPMNGVLGFIHLLRKTPLSPTQQEYLQTIEVSANNLLTIINDILDLSKLEAGRLKLKPEPFSLRRCIDNVLALLAPMAHQRRLDLIGLIFSDVPDSLVGDATRIVQVITNLLNNALKFTEQGQVILRVMLEQEDEHRVLLSISVSDTGMGIPESEQARIFEAFVQAGELSNQGGTGLGLSICKRLLEIMDGSLTLDSQPGKGSVFTFQLPLDKSTEDGASVAQQKRLDSAYKTALIDSHPTSRNALLNQLSELAAQAEGFAEHTQLEPAEYDLLLVSLSASEISKPDVIRTLKLWLDDLTTPCLLLLSSSEPSLFEYLALPGRRACLSKPVKTAVLLESLNRLLGIDQPPITNSERTDGKPVIDLTGRNILVTDDNSVNRQLMRALLTATGAQIIEAENGQQALQQYLDATPDLILMDIHMPVMNGLETASAIREQQKQPVLIVALTADVLRQQQAIANDSPFDAWVAKPVDADELLSLITKLFKAETPKVLPDKVPNQDDQAVVHIHDWQQALRIAGGSQQIAESLLLGLLKNLPHDLDQIKTQLEQRDWEATWQAVHKLLGSVSLCGLPALRKRLNQLQSTVRNRMAKQADEVYEQVQAEALRVMNLKTIKPTGSAPASAQPQP